MVTPISVILTLFLFFTEITSCRVQSAPMVYQRENNGSWTAYNIGRDYLGSITHVAKAEGIPIEENSYDPLLGRFLSPAPYVQAHQI